MQQQPIQPSVPSHGPWSPVNPVAALVEATDLDLGYEGAFPFLTESKGTEASLRC